MRCDGRKKTKRRRTLKKGGTLLNELVFENKNDNNYNFINERLEEIENSGNVGQVPLPGHRCEFIENWVENDNDEDVYFLHDNRNVYGAIQFERLDNIGEYPVFWVYSRCAFDRFESDEDFDVQVNNKLTSGRLLWIYALQKMAEKTNGNPFLVINKSTPDAKGYHRKMGMGDYNDVGLDQEEIIDYIYNTGDEEYNEEVIQDGLNSIDSENEWTYLFYEGNGELRLDQIFNRVVEDDDDETYTTEASSDDDFEGDY